MSEELGHFPSFHLLCLHWQSLIYLASSISTTSSAYESHVIRTTVYSAKHKDLSFYRALGESGQMKCNELVVRAVSLLYVVYCICHSVLHVL
jgi:hypothetical protein